VEELQYAGTRTNLHKPPKGRLNDYGALGSQENRV